MLIESKPSIWNCVVFLIHLFTICIVGMRCLLELMAFTENRIILTG